LRTGKCPLRGVRPCHDSTIEMCGEGAAEWWPEWSMDRQRVRNSRPERGRGAASFR
jgi:hypothetical protein